MEPGSKQDRAVNMTRAMEALSPWLNHPRRTIVQVEVLVVAAAALLLLQLILGSCKRRWHHSFVKGGLSMCRTLVFPLVLFTLGMMQSSPIKSSSYPIWAVVLMLASMGTTGVEQYDFYGSFGKNYMKFIVEICKYLFYGFSMVMLLLTPKQNPVFEWRGIYSSTSIESLTLVVLLTACFESGWSTMRYSKNYCRTLVAEWMEEPVNDHPCDSDPESMKGYNYAVLNPPIFIFLYSMPDLQDRSITIDQIWDCCGNSADGKALKDFCLSLALCQQLLKRRYFGEAFPEASLLKAHDFVFKKLLPSEGDFRRAFRIIEVELGLCYDFFFTKYHYTFLSMESWLPLIPLLVLLKVILILMVGVFAFRKSLVLETPNPIIEVSSTDADYIITLLVLGIVLVVEVAQAAFYLASDWVQVSLACRHVKKNCNAANAFIGRVINFLRKVIISGALRNIINQRSVIIKTKEAVKVSDAVKGAIARSLILTKGKLTNGQTSLSKSHMFEVYRWTFEGHSQLEVMLIWHIATEYCNISDDQTNGITPDNDRGIAVYLSRYCAYLIGAVPELLPYHEVDIRVLATKVTKERKQLFGSYKNSEIYDKMKNLEGTEEGDDPATVIKKGVKLGKQLEIMTNVLERWKVMGDFWAETILYIAPSHSTAKQHMLHLESGGEFLTHIWALLFHVGVLNLNRDSHAGILNLKRYKDQGVQAEAV